ncbi:MAG: arsenite methyltransferase [Anaerolineae bacterium]
MDAETIKTEVRKRYADHARNGGCSCGCSCSSAEADTTRLVEYTELAADVVEGSDLGLGCGLPTRHADLRPGETVLDLGSGAGVDVFIAARAVGPRGRVIGVDMTPEMIQRARNNAIRSGFRNVDFRLGEIEALPVESGTVGVVLSNCVINLVPDKRIAFAEIHRVLKPGGRFSISDIVSFGVVPETVRRDIELWAGCIAGAVERDAYLALIRECGFEQVAVAYQEEYSQFRGEDYGFASVTVTGVKG